METVLEGTPLLDYTLPKICFEYLDRMRTLCEENGIELILMKAPTNFWGYYWYDEWDAQIVDYAAENGLVYYNFIRDTEAIGLDMTADTYDAGVHLNVYGAEKLSRYFGRILRDSHGIPDRRDDSEISAVWQERTEAYRARKTAMEAASGQP
jgi:hypothetical protein